MLNLLRSRDERVIFCATLAAVAIFIALYTFGGNFARPLMAVNSDGYVPLGISLYQHGAFTYSMTPPYVPEAMQSPGYPLFLAVTAAPFGNVLFTLIVQAFLLATTAVLLYRLFEGAFSSRVRFWAALLFGIEPFTAYTAAQPLSEAVFLFLFILGLYILRVATQKFSAKEFFFAGLLLGASVMVRPIGVYLVPLVLVAGVFYAYQRGGKRAAHLGILGKKLVLALIGFAIVTLPWMYRNHQDFGIWTLSNKGPFTLYFYDAAQFLQYQEHHSGAEVQAELVARAHAKYPEITGSEDMRSPRYAAFMTHESAAILATAPLAYAKLHLLSMVTFFLSDGYRLLVFEATPGAASLPNITQALAGGHLGAVIDYFKSDTASASLFLLGFVFWGAVSVLAACGLVLCFLPKRQGEDSLRARRIAGICCLVALAYFALVTGPVAQARYRIVATPFLFMLAFSAAEFLEIHARFAVSHRKNLNI